MKRRPTQVACCICCPHFSKHNNNNNNNNKSCIREDLRHPKRRGSFVVSCLNVRDYDRPNTFKTSLLHTSRIMIFAKAYLAYRVHHWNTGYKMPEFECRRKQSQLPELMGLWTNFAAPCFVDKGHMTSLK